MKKQRRKREGRIMGTVIVCEDCNELLSIRPTGIAAAISSGYQPDWFMVKDRVWQRGQLKGKCRFLCCGCLEHRIGRKLTAEDFRRSARVNFVGEKSAQLRRRMRGLAKRLVETRFTMP